MTDRRIVVTGGSGRLGKYVVDEFIDHGYKVSVFDVREPRRDDVDFIKGSILNISECREAFQGADCVVHLAAIPHPLSDSPEKVMNVNVMGTFCVFQTACDLRIRRVVYASSDSAYGLVFKKRDFAPQYLPLDEEHPLKPQDPYGLSKKISEDMAEAFWHREGTTFVGLRICYVWFPDRTEEVRTDPSASNYYRTLVENPQKWTQNLWLYEHAKDAAQAFRLAAEQKDLEGRHEVFLISAADNGTKYSTAELLTRFYPGVPLKREISGNESLANLDRAKRMLGYKPRYSWRDRG